MSVHRGLSAPVRLDLMEKHISSRGSRLYTLVAECRPSFVEAAKKLKEKEALDFTCPCDVMDGRSEVIRISVIGVSSVANLVPTSAAIDSPEARK